VCLRFSGFPGPRNTLTRDDAAPDPENAYELRNPGLRAGGCIAGKARRVCRSTLAPTLAFTSDRWRPSPN
jgi:hypothetical protein